MFSCAKDIISNTDDLRTENQHIVNLLSANNYDTTAIERPTNKDREQNREFRGFINLPYVAGTSEVIRRVFTQHQFCCTFYTPDKIRKIL